MNGLLSMIGMQTELEYQMGDDFPFGSPRIRFNVPKGNIPSYKQKCQPKEQHEFTSRWWKWLKRASYSLFHYNKNAEQQKLIKRCINETASTIREHLINGYWRGDLSDYFKDGNFDVSLKHYKDTSYYNVMQWLDKKK